MKWLVRKLIRLHVKYGKSHYCGKPECLSNWDSTREWDEHYIGIGSGDAVGCCGYCGCCNCFSWRCIDCLWDIKLKRLTDWAWGQ